MFAALAHPTRLRIVHLLHSGKRSADDVAADLSLRRSSATHHLQILCAAGLVVRRGGRNGEGFALAAARGSLQAKLLECVESCFEG